MRFFLWCVTWVSFVRNHPAFLINNISHVNMSVMGDNRHTYGHINYILKVRLTRLSPRLKEVEWKGDLTLEESMTERDTL